MINTTKTLLLSTITLCFTLTTNYLSPTNALAKPLSVDSKTLISQNISPNYCLPEESVFLIAETASFWINICGGHAPYHYVGVNKKNGQSIRLPLQDYDAIGDYFLAVNGEYSYIVSFNTPKGSFLTVTKGIKELLREPLLNWQ